MLEQTGLVVAGAVVSLVFSIVLEDIARKWYGRARALKWTIMAALRSTTQHVIHDLFGIGRWRVPCVVLEGTPRHAYTPQRLTATLEQDDIRLPPELLILRERVVAQQEQAAKRTGIPTFSNGPMVALSGYRFGRRGPFEDSVLSLQFKRTDYYTFLATSMSLDEPVPGSQTAGVTVRERFLHDVDYHRPIP